MPSMTALLHLPSLPSRAWHFAPTAHSGGPLPSTAARCWVAVMCRATCVVAARSYISEHRHWASQTPSYIFCTASACFGIACVLQKLMLTFILAFGCACCALACRGTGQVQHDKDAKQLGDWSLAACAFSLIAGHAAEDAMHLLPCSALMRACQAQHGMDASHNAAAAWSSPHLARWQG